MERSISEGFNINSEAQIRQAIKDMPVGTVVRISPNSVANDNIITPVDLKEANF